MQDILLVSTLHDPDAGLLKQLDIAVPTVLSIYEGWVVGVTTTTDPEVKNKLRQLGVKVVEVDTQNLIVPNKIENDHLNALTEGYKFAEEKSITKIQYTDGDRIIMAACHYPGELIETAIKADEIVRDERSYLNLRRSGGDYLTHHPPLVETEFEFNRLYSRAFGQILDIGSTAHVMSTDVLAEILKRSPGPGMELVSFPHPKWLIIAKEMGAKILSLETQNVLSFEAPEQSRADVTGIIAGDLKEGRITKLIETGIPAKTKVPDEKPGYIAEVSRVGLSDLENYSLVRQLYTDTIGLQKTGSAAEWDFRFNTFFQYAGLLRNHLDLFEEKTKHLMRDEINNSIESMGRKREVILCALSRPENEIREDMMFRARRAMER